MQTDWDLLKYLWDKIRETVLGHNACKWTNVKIISLEFMRTGFSTDSRFINEYVNGVEAPAPGQ